MIACNCFTFAHYKTNPKAVQIEFKNGSNWNDKVSYKKQKHIGEHIQFLKELFRKKNILMNYVFEESGHSVVLMQGMNLKELTQTLQTNKAVKDKVIDYVLKPVNVTMFGQLRKKEHKHK